MYRNGRYFLGLAKGFLRFPTTYQDIEFSRDPEESDAPPLTTRNSEGQLVIEASLQYRLDLDKLIDIYRKYELNYHDRFVRVRAWEAMGRRQSERVLSNGGSRGSGRTNRQFSSSHPPLPAAFHRGLAFARAPNVLVRRFCTADRAIGDPDGGVGAEFAGVL